MANWRIALWVALVVATIAFLYAVRTVLLPFIFGWVIAVLLEPVVRKLRLRGMSRVLAVLLISLSFFVVVGALGVLLFPKISAQVSELRDSVQNLTTSMAEGHKNESIFLKWNPAIRAEPKNVGFVDKLFVDLKPYLERAGLPNTPRGLVAQYVAPHQQKIAEVVQGFFNSFLGLLGGAASQLLLLLFTPLMAFMFMLDMENFKRRTSSWIPPTIRKDTLSILQDVGEVFTSYLRGVAITVATYAVVMAVLLTLLGAPYPILVAILAGVLYLIPMLGAWITATTLFLVTGLSGASGHWFLHFGSPWGYGVVVALVFILTSTLFDQLVYPRIVGRSVGLHPLVSMFVIFSGGALFGLAGMLIAPPLAGVTKVILQRLIRLTTASTPESVRLPAVPLRHRQGTES